jgi:hypothetical protein
MPLRSIKVNLPGNFSVPPSYRGLTPAMARQLAHSGQIEPESADFPFTLEQLYLAQMRLTNAAFRLVSFHGGQALPAERLTAILGVLDTLRTCGLDVNTRSVFHGGKLK